MGIEKTLTCLPFCLFKEQNSDKKSKSELENMADGFEQKQRDREDCFDANTDQNLARL